MSYIKRISQIALTDTLVLKQKDEEYGGSWLKRGGVGAFMMLARKWDRLETAMQTLMMERPGAEAYTDRDLVIDKYDIIARAVRDDREEGLLDDIGDLRRYLLLVEAEIRDRQNPTKANVERHARRVEDLEIPQLDHRLDPHSLPEGTCFDGPTDVPAPGVHWPYEH